ncbi:ABC transporter permease [Demequina sp. NBRC 110057]|uniref:ABC transporter permease n=1 Tax=Demequina sp. NBRC 110057 TaxID=1570346 RepID=UPI000A0392A6|nr:ABC transporter permease [Demequina sp. NBRC 110057]
MSTDTTTASELRMDPSSSRPPARRGNPWAPSLHGVGLMTSIELRRRRPTTKGYIFYGILFALVAAICILAAVFTQADRSSANFELVLILVLGVGMLIAPSLSATSINGDSGEGVLAPLQMSHLTAGDIAFGKVIASWLVSVIALVALSPFLIYTYLSSGWHLGEVAMTIGAILFTVLAFTAVGLAWSSLAARAVASVSLAHLTTGVFLIGTLVAFAIGGALVTEDTGERDRYIDYEQLTPDAQAALEEAYTTGDYSTLDAADYPCVDSEWAYTVTHTDQIAWILLLNPAVMVIETAPIVDPETWEKDGRAAPGTFALLHQQISDARLGPVEGEATRWVYDECDDLFGSGAEAAEMTEEEMEAQWAADEAAAAEREQQLANLPRNPWPALGVLAVLFLGSMTIVVRRLRVPYKKLRSGTRVA